MTEISIRRRSTRPRHMQSRHYERSRSRRKSGRKSRSRRKSGRKSRSRRKSGVKSRNRCNSGRKSRRRKPGRKSRSRRKPGRKSRSRHKTNKTVATRINRKRNYMNPPKHKSSQRRPVSRIVKSTREPVKTRHRRDSTPSFQEYVNIVNRRNESPPVYTHPAMNDTDPRVKLYNTISETLTREIMRDEFFDNNKTNQVSFVTKQDTEYGKFQLSGDVKTVQVIEPINSTTFNVPREDSFMKVMKQKL